jgi:preprotein translocase subunit SecF
MRILGETNINFLKWRVHAFVLSAVVILGGLSTIVMRGGLPLGIDFTGGTALRVQFAEPVSEDAVRDALANLPGDKVVQLLIPGIGDPENEVLIRLPPTVEVEEGQLLGEAGMRAEQMLRDAGTLPGFTLLSRDVVGPVIGEDLQRKGIWATLTALAGILIYVGFRFRFTFAAGAIVAVFHDIIVTTAFLTWFGFELSLNVIAAILTITGYSVNDTIVIFDRVRENQRTARREPIDTLVNRSVNQTLSRTIITSGTTLLAVGSLFVLGGEVLRSFSFTMIVGILTGTYSTVFIASTLAILLSKSGTKAPVTQAQARGRSRRSA